ncbi:MAG: cation ABC transporter substrate-binding protein [Gloeocapsa sp. DLM2.Bin57]|nr:MAG: cation ABC transporter substrate-binding protein [Gloeocapsa sp. DLM2.Bin57]
MKNPVKTLLSVTLGLSLLTGCTANTESEELGVINTQPTDDVAVTNPPETLDLVVSILPQEYFVRKIAGEKAEVTVLVQPGSEPETYEPLPQQLTAISQSQAYIALGVSLERGWLSKIESLNPDLVIINSGEGVPLIPMVEHHHHHDHDHDHDHGHSHGEDGLDPHIWLSPQLVKIQAQNIYQGLVELDPENQAEYQQNLDNFLAEIDQLDTEIRDNLSGIENRKFIVFHPAWGYFAQEYDLEQIPIEVGGVEPSAAQLGQLVNRAQAEDIRVIFAQYQFNSRTAETIAQEIGGEVVFIDPIAPNWSENLLKVSETFANTLK